MDIERQKELELMAEFMAKKFFSNKPKWFESHEKADDDRFKAIQDTLKEIKEDSKQFRDKAIPVFEWFEHMTWDKKSRIQWLKVTGMIVGVVTGIFTIITGLWLFLKMLIVNIK